MPDPGRLPYPERKPDPPRIEPPAIESHAELVVKEARKVVLARAANLIKPDGTIKRRSEWPEPEQAAVVGYKTRDYFDRDGHKTRTETEFTMPNKVQALELELRRIDAMPVPETKVTIEVRHFNVIFDALAEAVPGLPREAVESFDRALKKKLVSLN